ncbi:MAG: 4Fe-4S dicluster domain-containing protein [Gammaproteobacteria bacterium]|nr:4Fe-4S dicluster domain-containing protein [Gammaproteobacteria bacterium]
MRITIDGRRLDIAEGRTILEACRDEGIEIPTLCFLGTLEPANACRLCVVEVEGSGPLVPSCSREVAEGMVVNTASDRVRHSRRMVLELLAATSDLSFADLDDMIESYGARPDRLHLKAAGWEPEVDNSLYARDLDRCILCHRCVDVCGEQAQNTFAITVAGRGATAHIATEFDVSLPESACVFCGNCVAICPTGALISLTEFEMRKEGTWNKAVQQITQTVCPFCGVGCNLELHVQDNRIVKVTSPPDHDITSGNLCIKGRFGYKHVE